MKTNTFLLLQILGLLFFGLNYYFEFIHFKIQKQTAFALFLYVFSHYFSI